VLYQPADPFGVLNVRLSAGHVLEVSGVEKPQLEVVFEHVVDRLPVDARPEGVCMIHRDCITVGDGGGMFE
jgi:hypothetical protein